MRRFSRALAYLCSFGLARGGLFVAPILLANLLKPADYGRFELAQACGSLGATVLALGTSAAVPLVLVRKIETAAWRAVLMHQVLVVSMLLLVAFVAWKLDAPSIVWMAAVCTGILMLQALWSVTLKSLGNGEASLLLDAGFWSVLALAGVAAFSLSVPLDLRGLWSSTALIAYLLLLFIWTSSRWAKAAPTDSAQAYAGTIGTGLPLMSVALLALLATTSGRLGIGLLSSPEVTAQYSVLFRATALPIVAHQVILVASFRQVFELSDAALERRLSLIVGLVIACVIGFWIFSDLAGLLLGPAFSSAFAHNRGAGLMILAQSVLWSAIALNDLVNTRIQAAGPVAHATALYFAIALPLAWWFLSGRSVTLALYVPVHSLVMGGYYVTQMVSMRSRGICLTRTWLIALGGFVILSVLAKTL